MCYNSVLNVKALEGAFNQAKALVGALSVIVKSSQRFVVSSSVGVMAIVARWLAASYVSRSDSTNTQHGSEQWASFVLLSPLSLEIFRFHALKL